MAASVKKPISCPYGKVSKYKTNQRTRVRVLTTFSSPVFDEAMAALTAATITDMEPTIRSMTVTKLRIAAVLLPLNRSSSRGREYFDEILLLTNSTVRMNSVNANILATVEEASTTARANGDGSCPASELTPAAVSETMTAQMAAPSRRKKRPMGSRRRAWRRSAALSPTS